MNKDLVNQRFIDCILFLIDSKKVPNKSFLATKMNISNSKLSEILKKRMNAGIDVLTVLVSNFNISSEWLLTGEGEMLKKTNTIYKEKFYDETLYYPTELIIPTEDGKPTLKVPWYVYYRFRNPTTKKFENFELKQGINKLKTISERKKAGEKLKNAINKLLQEGYSPFELKEEEEEEEEEESKSTTEETINYKDKYYDKVEKIESLQDEIILLNKKLKTAETKLSSLKKDNTIVLESERKLIK